MFDLADSQLAIVNTGNESTGIAAGNDSSGLHFWSQEFGGRAKQNVRLDSAAYSATVGGMALGVDTRNFADDITFGCSLGFVNSKLKSLNAIIRIQKLILIN